MRYFIEAAYDGTNYVGWQVQPNGQSVQGAIQEAMATVLRSDIEVTGCGRTDAGVHASQYFLHFNARTELDEAFVPRLNKLLPDDIAFHKLIPVAKEAHARFSAIKRGYEYHLGFRKEPLNRNYTTLVRNGYDLDWTAMLESCRVLEEYEEFKPFCKTGSDTPHFRCSDLTARWEVNTDGAVLYIAANRFLRGMVRLIVGAMIRIGRGQMTTDDLKKALDEQSPLEKADSAPPQGLILSEILYPEEIFNRSH